jgi:hypothetical protein
MRREPQLQPGMPCTVTGPEKNNLSGEHEYILAMHLVKGRI